MYGQDGDTWRQLVEAGIVDDGENNPDYIAGHFKDVAQFHSVYDPLVETQTFLEDLKEFCILMKFFIRM